MFKTAPNRWTRALARTAVIGLLVMASTAAFADNTKISPDLLPLLSNTSTQVNVIVQYNSPPQTCTINLLGNLICTTVNLLGGVVKTVFSLINAVAGTMPAGDVITLSNQV